MMHDAKQSAAEEAAAEAETAHDMNENEHTTPEQEDVVTDQSQEQKEVSESETGGNTDNALTELQAKYDSLNDKYLRLYSDFENLRRRAAREKLEMLGSAGSDIIKELLPVLDDLDRAEQVNEQTIDPEVIKEGFKLIRNKLMHNMEQRGLKPMKSVGEPFDTEFHEAITKIPAPKPAQKGKVVDEAEKGYFYNDKVLRYAKVIVGE